MTMLTDWDPKEVQWFDNLKELWEKYKDNTPMTVAEMLGKELILKVGLPICTLNEDQSKFFKRHLNADKYNRGPLVREMDVIREIEGW